MTFSHLFLVSFSFQVNGKVTLYTYIQVLCKLLGNVGYKRMLELVNKVCNFDIRQSEEKKEKAKEKSSRKKEYISKEKRKEKRGRRKRDSLAVRDQWDDCLGETLASNDAEKERSSSKGGSKKERNRNKVRGKATLDSG